MSLNRFLKLVPRLLEVLQWPASIVNKRQEPSVAQLVRFRSAGQQDREEFLSPVVECQNRLV